MPIRVDGRNPNQIRHVSFTRGYTKTAAGSVLVEFGNTRVLCVASITNDVPPFLEGTGKGWLTAEYNMLPGSTSPRKKRDRSGKVDGRSVEIQRLIGRSLRSIVNLDQLQEHCIWIDCDVLDADGGTRTSCITGAFVAVVDAIVHSDLEIEPSDVLKDSVAAISVGIVNGEVCTDLNYKEDSNADVDMNLVMTGSGEYIELQGTGENNTFSPNQLTEMLELGSQSIRVLTQLQKDALSYNWPFIDPSDSRFFNITTNEENIEDENE